MTNFPDFRSIQLHSLGITKERFGTIFAFVDWGNVDKWQKDSQWPVDIEKLAAFCDDIGCEEKYFYYGFYQDNPGSRFWITKAAAVGFQIRTKKVKIIPVEDKETGKIIQLPKCNFDVEIAMDVFGQMKKYETVMLFSGDSDFGELLNRVKSKGKKAIVVCLRSFLSSELREAADKLILADTLPGMLKFEGKNATPPKGAEE